MRNPSTRILAAAFVLVAMSHLGRAATWSGGGGDNNFTDNGNWSDNGTSGSDKPLIFPSSSNYTPYNDYGDGTDWQKIEFQSGASSYTLSGKIIDLFWKVENYDNDLQAVNLSLSSQGSTFELNPLQGGLTVSGTIWNNDDTLQVYGANGHTLTLSGSFQGSGGLVVEQNSTVVLSGSAANTYSGVTTIKAGKVILSKSASGTDAIAGGSAAEDVVVQNGAELELGQSEQINDAVFLEVQSGGTFDLQGYDETLALKGAGTVQLGSGSATLTIDNTGTDELSGTITGTGTVIKDGTGTQVLSSNNNFTGSTEIHRGTLQIEHVGALGSGATTLGSASYGATLRIADGLDPANAITVASGTGTREIYASGSGSVILSGGITLSDDVTMRASRPIATKITSGGNHTITKINSADFTLDGAGAFGGTGNGSTLDIQGDDLSVDHATALGTSTANSLDQLKLGKAAESDVQQLAVNAANAEIFAGITIDGNGAKTIRVNAGSGNTTTLSGDFKNYAGDTVTKLSVEGGNTLVLSGTISESGGVELTDSGTVKLEGENTYQGGTTITQGKLLVSNSGSGSGTGSGSVTVGSSGTLGGSGTIDGTVSVSGTLGPGESVGTLTVDDNVSFTDSSAVFDVEVSGSSIDVLDVSGTLTLNSATLQIGTLTDDIYVIARNATTISGTFNGLANGTSLSSPNNAYYIHYVDNGTDDYILLNKSPTLVVLTDFDVGVVDGQVVVSWATASELDTVGFFVERLGADGQWARLNASIIPAEGWPQGGIGATYEFIDETAVPGMRYTYRLIEVETGGSEEVYGPFERRADQDLELRSLVVVTPEGFSLRWLSREGEVYRLLRSEDLHIGGWDPVAANLPATPPENTWVDEESGSAGYYRVEVE